MSSQRLATPLVEHHQALGAKMADFAGYLMPMWYSSIAVEHRVVRESVGLFDVSHMARFLFSGEDSLACLQRAVSINAVDLAQGRAKYGFALSDAGTIIDDVIVYHLPDGDRLLVSNAGNRAAVVRHLDSMGGTYEDITTRTGMIAVQGPEARELIADIVGELPEQSMRVIQPLFAGQIISVATTGYTGEDGAEIVGPNDVIVNLWGRFLAEEKTASPAGLGARDTLRTEMGYPLYGHELDIDTSPWEAGLGFGINRSNLLFLGRDRVLELELRARDRLLTGLISQGRGIPRRAQSVVFGDRKVGIVTSGTFSPTLNCGIALAYVEPEFAAADVSLIVMPDSGAKAKPVEVKTSKLPLYSGGSRKSSRRASSK